MKKITLTSIAAVIGMFTFAIPVLAATTASLSPASMSVAPGEKFIVIISVNPQGTANYAEKLEVNYPSDILEAASFTLGDKWIAMTAAGYDSTDNINGVLIKTAGYPSGFSSSAVFGTVSFTAKKAGSGTIKIGNSSLAFQASAQSAITGNETTFVVTAPVVPIPKPEVKTPTPKPAPAPETGIPTETTATTSTTTETALQPAAVALSPLDNILTLGTGSAAVAALVTILILGIIGGGIWLWRRSR